MEIDMEPIIKYYKNGQKRCEKWLRYNNRHRINGPTNQSWYEDGQKSCEEWCENDKRHRIDGPAYQSWYPNGQKKYEEWFIDNLYHRIDGPAIQGWYGNVHKWCEEWWINGKWIKDPKPYKTWLIDNNLFEKWPWNDEELVLWRLTWDFG